MSKLPAAALRVCKALDDPEEVFNADRVFKLLFLADWKAVLSNGEGITGITWTGGGAADLVGDVADDDDAIVEFLQGATGSDSRQLVIDYLKVQPRTKLSDSDESVIDFVLKQAGRKNWRELNDLVFSTRPLLAGRRDRPLDLAAHASDHLATSPRSAELTTT